MPKVDLAEKVKAIMEEFKCKREDATLLVELEEILGLLEYFMEETLEFDTQPDNDTYKSKVTIKEFTDRRTAILLRLTNIKDILMAAHEQARNIWGDYMTTLVQKFRDIDNTGQKKAVYDFRTELLIFYQEMRNYIQSSDISRMLSLRSQTMAEPDKVFEKAMRSIGRSHDARWAFSLLVKYGRGNAMTVEQLAAESGFSDKKVRDAIKELIHLGSMIVECGYSRLPDTDKLSQTYYIPDVFRNRYWGGAQL
jgi:hypothetical protein